MYSIFFFQAEDGIRDAQESRGLGDVYKRQGPGLVTDWVTATVGSNAIGAQVWIQLKAVLLTIVLSLIHI